MKRFSIVFAVPVILLCSYLGLTNAPAGTITWALTQQMNSARTAHTATLLLDGRVLVVGGIGAGSDPRYGELYDPITAEWSKTPSLGYPVDNHTATLLPDCRAELGTIAR